MASFLEAQDDVAVEEVAREYAALEPVNRTATAPPRQHEGPAGANAAGGHRRGMPPMWADGTSSGCERVNRQFRFFPAGAGHGLPLPKPLEGAILASELSGIWRMSAHKSLFRTRL
jgi:hypothetical protein